MTQSRALIAATIASLAFYVVGAVALGTPPAFTDSPSDVLTWAVSHHSDLRVAAWSATFGTLSLAVFLGIIRGVLPKPHADIFLIGGVVLIAQNGIQAWLWGALAAHPASLQPETARLVLDVASFWGSILTGATMTMIGAVTALRFRAAGAIPGWLFIVGVVAFVEQAVETVTVFGTHGFLAPGGDMIMTLGSGLTVIWLLALAVWAVGRLRVAPLSEAT